MIKSNYALKRKELFSKYKQNHNIFFESGTHHGFSVQIALDLEFSKIISVEIEQEYFLECFDKFTSYINEGRIHLFYGDSNVWMDRMLKLVEEPALFWLDGHPDGVSGDPLWEELEAIKKHSIKNHTIIVDDIPVYFNSKQVEDKILEINPNYQFIYEDALNESNLTDVYQNYDLVAYIKD
jgi:hypothetical protein